MTPQERRHEALVMLAGAIGSRTEFLETAVKALALGLNTMVAAIGEASEDQSSVNLLVLLKDGEFILPYTYDLSGTPCEGFYNTTEFKPQVRHSDGLCALYPEDTALIKMGAEGYRGEAFHDSDGNRIGHVFVIDNKPIAEDSDEAAFFSLISQRIGAEINRWRADAALKEERHLLQTIVDNLPIPINLNDADGNYLLVNKLFENWYGKPADQVIGHPAEAVFNIPAETLKLRSKMERDAMETGETLNREEMKSLADGSHRYVIVTKFPVRDSNDKVIGYGSTSTDITERKENEIVLREAKERSEMANRSKSDFLANMSHELRTPLNSIIGFSQIIIDGIFGSLNPKYLEYVQDINGSGRHLLNVINDILDISKVEAGEIEVDETDVDILDIAENCLKMLHERIILKSQQCTLNVSPDLPKLRADDRLILQILVNLLSNANKFTPDGGAVTVSVNLNSDDGIEIRVVDSGIGIAPEDMPRALEQFGQVRSASILTHEGTGLGLPLSRKLAELHDGSLSVESEVGKGTTVIVAFPPGRTIHPY